jgi:hypothetical protein
MDIPVQEAIKTPNRHDQKRTYVLLCKQYKTNITENSNRVVPWYKGKPISIALDSSTERPGEYGLMYLKPSSKITANQDYYNGEWKIGISHDKAKTKAIHDHW